MWAVTQTTLSLQIGLMEKLTKLLRNVNQYKLLQLEVVIMDNDINELLNTDPIHNAEQMTGKHYQDDKVTAQLGLLLSHVHNNEKRKKLKEIGDSHYNISMFNYLKVLDDIGFRVIHNETFARPRNKKESYEESFFILWEPERSILLTCETYKEDQLNKADFWYNWKPDDIDGNWSKATSSGKFQESENYDDMIWIGHHDGREAIKTNIQTLEDYGEFISPWVKPYSTLWLYHNGHENEYPNFNFRKPTCKYLQTMPEEVTSKMGDLTQISGVGNNLEFKTPDHLSDNNE
jgi:hypothetical protein